MITSLNPKFCFAIAALSIIALFTEMFYSHSGLPAFILGFAFTIPLISKVWDTMKSNWPVYRKFYSMPFRKRDQKTINKSWRLTWWMVPYTLLVYTSVNIYITFNPVLGTVYSMLYGVVFAVFGYTMFQSKKYYEDVRKTRKKYKK